MHSYYSFHKYTLAKSVIGLRDKEHTSIHLPPWAQTEFGNFDIFKILQFSKYNLQVVAIRILRS